ncbi:hypothetical protein LTR56_028044 [Elasticomyces elasticus]|nr:hypothetical protein LTR56_028044 [Elasticomyces elasticus]
MPAHGGVSTTAVVDFVERVRLELATTDPEDLAETLESLSWRLESQATCSAACANALLPYAETHLLSQSRTRRQPCIARLTAISRAGGTLNNFQRDRAMAVVTLHWTKDIVEYYHFAELGRPTLMAMQKVAAKYPQWTQAVHRINAAMLSRHVEHILQPRRSNWRIGDHAGATKKLGVAVQGHPIDRTDLELVSKWAGTGSIVLGGEEMPNANHEASTKVREYIARWTALSELPSDIRVAAKTSSCNHNRCFSLKLDINGLLVPSQIAGTKRGAIDSCQSSEKKRRTNLVQDDLSLATASTPPPDSPSPSAEYQEYGDEMLAQGSDEGSSEMAVSLTHAPASPTDTNPEEHHLVDAAPINSTPVPDPARSMDSSAECYDHSETGLVNQHRHTFSPDAERLIPEDQDAESTKS